MAKAIWRQFLENRASRSAEVRLTPAYDSKLAEIEERLSALERGAEDGNTAVLSEVERVRLEIRRLAGEVEGDESAALSVFQRIAQRRPATETLFVPPIGLAQSIPGPFMEWSTCSASDFTRPEFASICAEVGASPRYHRKLWEWVFIVHHLRRMGMLTPGKRGLVFGVGRETLPSFFAKLGSDIMATDGPESVSSGWSRDGQFSSNIDDLHFPEIVDEGTFRSRVSYAACDMNAIGNEFEGFDFCWSSCCFEHLGNLRAGMDFVVNSVEMTLKPGGIACHTTEFNLSSNQETIESGETAIYRKRDIEELVQRLRERGHEVDEFKIAPDHHPLDFHVDSPPYKQDPHLKLKLFGFTSTSAGLVIKRGVK